jgi:hypothetical protein
MFGFSLFAWYWRLNLLRLLASTPSATATDLFCFFLLSWSFAGAGFEHEILLLLTHESLGL